MGVETGPHDNGLEPKTGGQPDLELSHGVAEAESRDYTNEFYEAAIRLTNLEDPRAYVAGLMTFVDSLPGGDGNMTFPTDTALADYLHVDRAVVARRLHTLETITASDENPNHENFKPKLSPGGLAYDSQTYRYVLWDLIIQGYRFPVLTEHAASFWKGFRGVVADYHSWQTLKEFAANLTGGSVLARYAMLHKLVRARYGKNTWPRLCGNTIIGKQHQPVATLPPEMQQDLRDDFLEHEAAKIREKRQNTSEELDLEGGENGQPTEDDLSELADELSLEEDDSDDLLTPDEINELSEDIEAVDTVQMYLDELRKTPLLSADEEVDLAIRIEKGRRAHAELAKIPARYVRKRAEPEELVADGNAAREHFIKANLRLVVSIAKKFVGRGVPFLDLIQEGNLGLMTAVEKFDPDRGYRFSTYGTWWIRQGVQRAIANQGKTIRIPAHMGERIGKLIAQIRDLEQRLGRDPTLDEVAQKSGMKKDKIEYLLAKSLRTLSLDAPPKPGNGDERERFELTPDTSQPPVEEAATEGVLAELLLAYISGLPDRERDIIHKRFWRDETLKEVGKHHGVTREWIRRLEAKALGKLRHPSRSRPLRDFVE